MDPLDNTGRRSIDPLTANYRRQKSALTRALKQAHQTGEGSTVLNCVEAAYASFDKHGWPDDWAHFERAKHDAISAAIFLQ